MKEQLWLVAWHHWSGAVDMLCGGCTRPRCAVSMLRAGIVLRMCCGLRGTLCVQWSGVLVQQDVGNLSRLRVCSGMGCWCSKMLVSYRGCDYAGVACAANAWEVHSVFRQLLQQPIGLGQASRASSGGCWSVRPKDTEPLDSCIYVC